MVLGKQAQTVGTPPEGVLDMATHNEKQQVFHKERWKGIVVRILDTRPISEYHVKLVAYSAKKSGGYQFNTGLINLLWYIQQGQYPKLKIKKKDKEKISLN